MLNKVIDKLKEEARTYIGICFGVFLIILFFQPFEIERFDYNTWLIFIGGLSGILLLWMVVIRAALHTLMERFGRKVESLEPNFIGRFLLLLFTAVSFAFYLKYVGGVNISFFTMAKVTFICFIPPLFLYHYDTVRAFKIKEEQNLLEFSSIKKELSAYKSEDTDRVVELFSDKGTDKITLKSSEIGFFKSADNYVELYFLEEGVFRKKLIRNTLTSIENQLSKFPEFVRCHRGFIVNVGFVIKLSRRLNNYWIVIRGSEETLPVSRQYLLKLKESI